MRPPFRRFVFAILVMGAIAGVAQTDTTPASGTGDPKSAKVKKALSPAEMKTSAEAIQAQIKDDYAHVLRLQALTRRQKDLIKLNCVNDKLVELKAKMNIADTANSSLNDALTKGVDPTALYTQLETTGHAIKELREEANTCLGESELFKQEAGIDVQRPDTPDDPGTIDPYGVDDGVVVVEPPGYASPFN